MENKKKVALYCRVSTREQNTDNQKNILIQRAVREDWDFEVFEEQECSRNQKETIRWLKSC